MKVIELEKDKDKLIAQLQDLNHEITILESLKIENLENREKFAALYNQNLIRETGNCIIK